MTDDLPVLSSRTRQAYLERLEVAAVDVDLAGLTALQTNLLATHDFTIELLRAEGHAPILVNTQNHEDQRVAFGP